MRDELHLMELVDRYLDGSMNAEERKAFETRASANAELRELIEDQRALREGATRLPVRAAAAKAYRSYRLGKPGPWIGGAVIVAVIITTAFFVLRGTPHFVASERSSTTSDVIASIPSDQVIAEETLVPSAVLSDTLGTHIAPLVMIIDPNRDTTMLTPNGVLLDVPKGSFVDSMGSTVRTAVRITMLEAFDAVTIMKAGLSTMSGDTLLETGGMFYLDATSQGKKVGIATGKALNVMVPADGVSVDMLLYDGAMRPDGIIDWRDPVALPRSLVPVDIRTLDFYPPGYEAKLAELGQNVRNKAFTDSLYYSLDCSDRSRNSIVTQEAMGFPTPTPNSQADTISYLASSSQSDSLDTTTGRCGVDPSKVKAIWDTRFNHTNLATREFEERMRAIHGTCDNAVLDLYVNNLTDDLRTIDRRVAQMGFSSFSEFAKRNDGRVALPAASAERLERIYAEWSRAYAEATRKAQDTFWNEQRKLDVQGQQRARVDGATEQAARQRLLNAETEANLRSVYAQMGYASVPSWVQGGQGGNNATASVRPITLPRVPRSAFNARVSSFGWKNCDVAFSLAYSRRTTNMGSSGKRATINYDPCVVVVPEANTYDQLRVYLLPREGAGYQRMNHVAADRYQENLNGLYTYDVVVLGNKDGRSWYYEYDKVSGLSALTASLAPIKEEELGKRLSRFERTRAVGLLETTKFLAMAAKDAKRQRANMDRVRLRQAVLPVVFPCGKAYGFSSEAPAQESVGDIETALSPQVGSNPEFPGGTSSLFTYLQRNIRVPNTNLGDGRVVVSFIVNIDGSVSDITIARSGGSACDQEAIRVVRGMPRWKPGQISNRTAPIRYNLPVNFKWD
ncbi:MAG: energy transducer TonB [Flavobacteriales bacterium]